MAKTVNYDAVFPVFNIENSSDGGAVTVLKDGRIAISYRFEGVEAESITDGGYDALSSAFYRASRTLPVGTVIQRLDAYYTEKHRIPKGLQEKSNAPFTQQQHSHMQDKPVLHHVAYLFLSFGNERQPRANAANTIWARVGLPMLKNPSDGIDALAERAERAAEEFVQSISIGQLKLSRLDEEELENLYFQYFNLEFDRQPTTINRSVQPDASFVAVGEKESQYPDHDWPAFGHS